MRITFCFLLAVKHFYNKVKDSFSLCIFTAAQSKVGPIGEVATLLTEAKLPPDRDSQKPREGRLYIQAGGPRLLRLQDLHFAEI